MDEAAGADNSNVVRQGFICPFCMEDFGEYERLMFHVEDDHPEEDSSDLAGLFVSNVKGFFDKAKRGIQKLDAKKSIADIASNVESELAETTEKLAERGAPLPRIPKPLPPDEISPGTMRSKTREFMATRELNINEVAVRTNMLIIRLDRLINGGPKDKDPVKRKEFEREIVPWLDDAEAPCCPLCAARFGLTRRRHHCRLCGKVLCHSCSEFLSFDTARSLTSSSNPLGDAHIDVNEKSQVDTESSNNDGQNTKRNPFFSFQHKMDKMKKAMAEAVQKVHSAAAGEEIIAGALNEQEMSDHMRVCNLCLRDLHLRESQMEKKDPPAYVQQYDFMQELIEEVKNLVPTYVRVVVSLKNGESVYTHQHGEELRSKCLEIQKNIEILSKRIAEGADDKPNAAKEQQLRRNIRLSAVQSLQGLIGQMESLPTAEECANRIAKRKEKRVKDFARVNRTVMKMSNSLPQLIAHPNLNSTGSVSSLGGGPPSLDDGWTAEDNDLVFEPSSIEDDTIQTNHPLYEQREQLRKFLYQASSTGKMDEMDILERNLKEIEEEMIRLGLPC